MFISVYMYYDSLTTVFFVFNDFQKNTIFEDFLFINSVSDFNPTSQLMISIIKK